MTQQQKFEALNTRRAQINQDLYEMAAKMAIAKANRDAIKTQNTVDSDFPKAKRTFTYKAAGQL